METLKLYLAEAGSYMHKDYLFRVSLKAVIRNDRGELLIVKEKGHRKWSLPGGGLDWGETYEQAMRRELYEEVGYAGEFTMKLIAADDAKPLKNRPVDTRQVRLIYEIIPENYEFIVGKESDDIAWVNASSLDSPDQRYSALVYTYVI